jgi:hypothetical protein
MTSASAMSWWEQVTFNEMVMSSVQYTNTLSCIFMVLAQRNNSPRIDMLLHTDTLTFLVNPSVFLLLNTECSAAKQQIPIILYLIWLDSGSTPRYIALEESPLTIKPLMRCSLFYTRYLKVVCNIARWCNYVKQNSWRFELNVERIG